MKRPSAEARDLLADQFDTDEPGSRKIAARIREGTFSNYWLDRSLSAIDKALDIDREYARN